MAGVAGSFEGRLPGACAVSGFEPSSTELVPKPDIALARAAATLRLQLQKDDEAKPGQVDPLATWSTALIWPFGT